MQPVFSLIIPVYRNEENIPSLLAAITELAGTIKSTHGIALEAVLVVDGSPDNCFALLRDALPRLPLATRLLLHSRNFGSFAAIRTGLQAASGSWFGVMAADLQEPPELMLAFAQGLMENRFDVMVGTRSTRADPWRTRWPSAVFWRLYKAFVNDQIPTNGVDVFGCNRVFRDHLLALEEAHSSLVGLIYWLGFRRGDVPYERRARELGRSAWTLKRKLRYLSDSIFSFTDLPVRLLTTFGGLGLLASVPLGIAVIAARLSGVIDVPGYAATIVTVMFFGALNALGLGLIGSYTWRTYENTKRRPLALVFAEHAYDGHAAER